MKTHKKLLALLLSVVMMFSLSVTAFASWNQFQKDSSNNGRVSISQMPTSLPSSSYDPKLTSAANRESYTGLPGIDTTPVISGDMAYVLYHAGDRTDDNGGVRVAGVDMSYSTTQAWNVRLGDSNLDTDNMQQLGTPYYDEDTSTLFAPVTYNKDILDGKTITVSEGASITNGILSLPANGETEITISDVVLEGATKSTYFATGIITEAGKSISGSVTFTKADGTSKSFGTSMGYDGYEFCLYNNAEVDIEAGTYTITILISTGSAYTGTSKLHAVTPYWKLYQMTATSSGCTNVSVVQKSDGSTVEGAGQTNTPITGATYNGHTYLFFGIYDGDRAYYQYDYTAKTLTFFTSGEANDGFYWAGAAVVGSNVVFGAENGYVYSRPIGSSFGSASGSKVNLHNIQSGAGKVRSSICYDASGGYLYLTTSNAYLWKLSTNLSDASAVRFADDEDNSYVKNSSSTPAVSLSGRIYVGGYNIYWDSTGTRVYKGALKSVKSSDWTTETTPTVYTNWQSANSGAIQSSPVVGLRALGATDFVCFTTNGPDGDVLCVKVGKNSTGLGTTVWTCTSGTYTLQGVAISDNGAVVFGNDNNRLCVYKK